MSITRVNFESIANGGDTPTAAFVKLDANCADLDTRLVAVKATADESITKAYADVTYLAKTGGNVAGNLAVNGTFSATGNVTFGGNGTFGGDLTVTGAGTFSQKLTAAFGVFQIGASSGQYAQMDYQGRVSRSVGTNPTSNSATLAHSVTGSFGGGYLIVDGTNAIGMWSTSGALNIGFGQLNAALTSRFTLSTNGNLSIAGTLSQSDYRLKREIGEIDPEEAYNAVLAVRPIRYVRIDFPEDQQRVTEGVIAHELAEAMPNLVVGVKDQMSSVDVFDDEGNVVGQNPVPSYQTVDYNGIGVELVAAFKHLDGIVKAQAAVIEEMRQQLAGLAPPATE